MLLSNLNVRALSVLKGSIDRADELRISVSETSEVSVIDFGVNTVGGLAAGLRLAEICTANLADIRLQSGSDELNLPSVTVTTDHPVSACLLSQYAGWKIATDDYFGMGSGPMRALAQKEPLFEELAATEDKSCCVGVLESSSLPTKSAIDFIQDNTNGCEEFFLAVAPTASQSGNVQVVARSLETAMHKLHDIGFPLEVVDSGQGTAPLPPVAANDLSGIGRTNDSILYGSTVNIWVRCDDELIEKHGPQVPSSASGSHGKSFMTLFKEANHDFYGLDPALFSPAVIVFHNLTTGNSFRYGTKVPEILRESFGL